ncbi:MAG: hypothetical protein MIK27_05695 [Sphingomonas sanguinis]|jgi:hypothetical protein|nr:hypothetical protein [Sphingomonas sanguinis]
MPSAADVSRQFLSAIWAGEAPDMTMLIQAIDRLLAQSHDTASGDCTGDDVDPPSIDAPSLYRCVADRFPYLGLYCLADPLASLDEKMMLGDGVDDIADITRDLREVIWWDENYGPDDAAFNFRLLFPHWGRHARALSGYLHAHLWG